MVGRLGIFEKISSFLLNQLSRSLRPHLQWRPKIGRMDSFLEMNGMCGENFADHTLTFMIRGDISSWKQVVDHIFTANYTFKLRSCFLLSLLTRRMSS